MSVELLIFITVMVYLFLGILYSTYVEEIYRVDDLFVKVVLAWLLTFGWFFHLIYKIWKERK